MREAADTFGGGGLPASRGRLLPDGDLSSDLLSLLGVAAHQVRVPELRGTIVERPRVAAALASTTTPVVSVVAGAGYGKTIALQQHVRADARTSIWASVRGHHHDPNALARLLAAAFLVVAPDRDLCAAVADPHPSAERVVAAFDAMLRALPGPFVMVVDDAHLVTEPAAYDLADHLLDLVPAGSQVFLLGRSVPAARLARRLAGGHAEEVGADTLAFTPVEAAELLAVGPPPVDRRLAEGDAGPALGWPVGLRFAALDLARRPEGAAGRTPTPGARHLAVYVHEELLDGLAAEDRHLVRCSAVLERPTGEGVDALLATTGSGERLDAIARAGLLVLAPAAGDPGPRYEPAFRAVLLDDLRSADPVEHDRLFRCAVAWHLERGDGAAAVRHAMALGDRGLVAEVIVGQLGAVLLRGEVSVLAGWLGWFGPEEQRTDPLLALAAGWLALMTDRGGDLARWLAHTERLHRPGPCPDGTESFELACAVLRMVAGVGGVRATIAHADAVLAAGPGAGPFLAVAAHQRAVCCYLAGDVADAREAFGSAEFAARAAPSMHVLTMSHLALGALRRGDHADAQALLARCADEIAEASLADYPIMCVSYSAQAYAHALRGDAARSVACADRALAMVEDLSTVFHRGASTALLALADAALVRQDARGAAVHLAAAEVRLRHEPDAAVLHEWAVDLHRRIGLLAAVPGAAELTPAELRVLEQLASHRSLGEIGEALYVSRNTVKSHTLSIYRKLSVAGRSQAVEAARALGLIDRAVEDRKPTGGLRV